MKTAFITGINGQDGSYLAELLLEKGYSVHGTIRRTSSFNTERIDHIGAEIVTHYGDLTDSSSLIKLLDKINPDEIYNLGAQSHVKVSFDVPEFTADVNALGTIRLLDAIRDHRINTKLYQASTSELFGGYEDTIPQNELTPFRPRSPYACAKLYGYWITCNYREAYGIYACNGILFNHESPRRGGTFVTKKITRAVAQIASGRQKTLTLGNLYSKRDWGYAKDYVEAMWLMLQQEIPDDFVISTGEAHTVKEFVEVAFSYIGKDIVWQGEGLNEVGLDSATGDVLVSIDEKYFRPTEVDYLLGDYTKAKKILNWEPKTKFRQLVEIMMRSEFDSIESTQRWR